MKKLRVLLNYTTIAPSSVGFMRRFEAWCRRGASLWAQTVHDGGNARPPGRRDRGRRGDHARL